MASGFASLTFASSLSFTDTGRVLHIGDVAYYAGGTEVGRLNPDCLKKAVASSAQMKGFDLLPLTVVESSDDAFGADELRRIVAQYEQQDDVFTSAFLKVVYLQPLEEDHALLPTVNVTSLESTLAALNTSLFLTPGEIGTESQLLVSKTINGLTKGPYFISPWSGSIYKAHRLYNDDNLAFVQGVVSDEQDGYLSLPALTANVMAKSIAVPSRLYSSITAEKPLAGLRFGVKDIFHVRGVATSGGNRAYFYHYGVQNTTGPAVQRLIDLGAVLVGKMGTVQFANGDRPTADWVDLHAPFNPRGDGYQDPSGSSTGPGVGIGAYEWLDLAVGSDTGGSMRGPAGSQGIFGNRPSTGAISLDGVIPLSPVSDSAGVFARSGALWASATRAWYNDTRLVTNHTSYPRRLFTSTARAGAWSGTRNDAALILVDNFYSQLSSFLNTSALPGNYTQLWKQTRTSNTPQDVNEMLHSTYGVYIAHDQWNMLGKPFFESYAAANDERQPYINPGPLARWKWGQQNATDEHYANALRNISMFKSWHETQGYGRHDAESCSESVYAYLWQDGTPSYRDQYFAAPTQPPLGMDETNVAVFAGAPEVVVPIGEVAYNSTRSMHEEYAPVAVALRMARGCDFALASLVSGLEEIGILRPVAAGSRLYPM
ncbi:hypothetical protein MBLNU13_g07950t2 [Cladosporium sp. NU13]